MMGAIVVIGLVSLVFPIALLLLALLFDAVIVMWVAAGYAHDRWAGQVGSLKAAAVRRHLLPLHWPHLHAR